MSLPYDETLNGLPRARVGPGARHEMICDRLHRLLQPTIAKLTSTRLLVPRAKVLLSNQNIVCPDLSLVTAATGKLWLAAEIVNSEDHASDTVVKKQIYEDHKLPRLWMVDPRYDNVEVYHATPYGMTLKGILAGRELLTEQLLPEFQLRVSDLFAPA
jgi:Uma2 family endonuclease